MKTTMILGLVLGAAAVMGCTSGKGKPGQESLLSSEANGIFACNVGRYEVYMLVEGQREGNAGILVGASEDILARYIPESGFMHSANAFLIKMPDRNIMIDMGTGAGGVLLEKIKNLGVQPDKVDAVLLTHLHGDHFGGLVANGEATLPNAKIYLSAKEPQEGAAAALAAYEGKVETFDAGELSSPFSVLPGIGAIANYGHTPGHVVYLIENGGSKLIIAGDFLHVGVVQFAHPEISASYDADKEAAAASRRQILAYAAQNKTPIGGMHIVYPGVGNVDADGEGFKFSPAK